MEYTATSRQTIGTNRLLCWIVCSISRVQISDNY